MIHQIVAEFLCALIAVLSGFIAGVWLGKPTMNKFNEMEDDLTQAFDHVSGDFHYLMARIRQLEENAKLDPKTTVN